MSKDKWKDIQQLVKEIEQSNGYKIDTANFYLEISFKILVANFAYLKNKCENIPTFSHNQNAEKEKIQIEIMGFLVNFLNANSAFICHMRNHMNGLYKKENPDFLEVYQSKIEDEFKNNQLAGFIIDLRNYYDHYTILPVGLLMFESNGELQTKAYLSRVELLNNSNQFKKCGKAFLHAADEYINILEICENYIHKTLFVWLMQQQEKLHGSELDELEELKEKGRKLYDK